MYYSTVVFTSAPETDVGELMATPQTFKSDEREHLALHDATASRRTQELFVRLQRDKLPFRCRFCRPPAVGEPFRLPGASSNVILSVLRVHATTILRLASCSGPRDLIGTFGTPPTASRSFTRSVNPISARLLNLLSRFQGAPVLDPVAMIPMRPVPAAAFAIRLTISAFLARTTTPVPIWTIPPFRLIFLCCHRPCSYATFYWNAT